MTVAGSDSGGGAGIQADLKTFSALGVFGASTITALTAQNTQTVNGIHDVPPEFVVNQLETVLEDMEYISWNTSICWRDSISLLITLTLLRRSYR